MAGRLVRAALPWLEFAHGLAVCAEGDCPYAYQWSYPDCWPPIVHLAVCGLKRYSYRDDALGNENMGLGDPPGNNFYNNFWRSSWKFSDIVRRAE